MKRKLVIEHLRHDIKEHKEAICDDKRLLSKLSAKLKKRKTKPQRRARLWD